MARAHTSEPLVEYEPSPFGGMTPLGGRGMTFRVQDGKLQRYERAALRVPRETTLEWLWPGHIPYGRISLFSGPAGSGKSLLAVDLLARVASDRAWPDGTPQPHPGGSVVYLGLQDDLDDVVAPRLQQAGASPQRCRLWSDFDVTNENGTLSARRDLVFPQDLPILERLLDQEPGIRLLVIDGASDFCKSKRHVPELLRGLNRILRGRQVAAIVTLRANGKFNRAGEPVLKSSYDTSAARCEYCCLPDPEQENHFFWLPLVMNYSGLPPGRGYKLGPNQLTWDDTTVDPRHPLPSETACGTWLTTDLKEEDQWASDMTRKGVGMGFSPSMIQRTRNRLGIKHRWELRRGKRHSMWSLGAGRPSDIIDEILGTPPKVSMMQLAKKILKPYRKLKDLEQADLEQDLDEDDDDDAGDDGEPDDTDPDPGPDSRPESTKPPAHEPRGPGNGRGRKPDKRSRRSSRLPGQGLRDGRQEDDIEQEQTPAEIDRELATSMLAAMINILKEHRLQDEAAAAAKAELAARAEANAAPLNSGAPHPAGPSAPPADYETRTPWTPPQRREPTGNGVWPLGGVKKWDRNAGTDHEPQQ